MDFEKIDQAVTILEENCANISSVEEATIEIESESFNYEEESYISIKDFLESQLGSHEELEMKKLIALSAVASGSNSSPTELATEADASAVSAKVAYKTDTGDLDIIEATDILIDHGAIRLNTIIQSNLNMVIAGEFISETIALAYPPAKAVKPFIKALVIKAEPIVRKTIETGIKEISTLAKQTVRNFSTQIKNYAKSLLNA